METVQFCFGDSVMLCKYVTESSTKDIAHLPASWMRYYPQCE